MNTVQVAIQLSSDDLLTAVAQLGTSELEAFSIQISNLVAQRKSLDNPEQKLLQKIHQSIPQPIQQQITILLKKREAETLTPEENQEFIQLTQQVETLNVDRITHLAALAKLRNQPLKQLMQDLNLQPIEYV
ncbi:MAG: STAS/SEC14 domain-containing protein [Alkalinema sp. CAN_BIN05]|nr:STAS/SEC14 domain-containing protein [Alkalinema sp. CAN_BIN05]